MNMITARTMQLAGMATLAGVGFAVTNDYLNGTETSVKDVVDKVKRQTTKVFGAIKNKTRETKEKQSEIENMAARMSNFYIGVVQTNENLQFGTDVKLDHDLLVFETYAEAKMNMMNVVVPKSDVDYEVKRELVAMAMDYGALVERTLSREEDIRVQNVNDAEVTE